MTFRNWAASALACVRLVTLLLGVLCTSALGTCLRGQTANQTAEIVARLKEIKDDPNMSAATRDSAKKLLDEIGKNDSRIRWDGPEGPPIARTTPDEPGRPPAIKDKFRKKWGKKQLIVISRNWRKQLDDWHPIPTPGLGPKGTIDVLISTLLHELEHAEEGDYDWPPPTPHDEALCEIPAYQLQIEFLQSLIYLPPYWTDPPGYVTAEGAALRKFIQAKQKQLQEWQAK